MQILGINLRITVGKKITEGIVELKQRRDGNVLDVTIKDLIDKVKKCVKDGLN
jgi:prolyl-tRNA synthetase